MKNKKDLESYEITKLEREKAKKEEFFTRLIVGLALIIICIVILKIYF